MPDVSELPREAVLIAARLDDSGRESSVVNALSDLKKTLQLSSEHLERVEEKVKRLRKLSKRVKNPRMRSRLEDFLNLIQELHAVRVELNDLSAVEEPRCTVCVAGEALARCFLEQRSWVVDMIRSFNKKVPTLAELRQFLQRADEMFRNGAAFLEHSFIRDALGLSRSSKHILNTRAYRLKMPIHSIFDTGVNLLLLGVAGSGKTTSMQMYVKRRTGMGDKVYLFAPLAHLVFPSDDPLFANLPAWDRLLVGLSSYLQSLGCKMDKTALFRLLQTQKVVLLFDA